MQSSLAIRHSILSLPIRALSWNALVRCTLLIFPPSPSATRNINKKRKLSWVLPSSQQLWLSIFYRSYDRNIATSQRGRVLQHWKIVIILVIQINMGSLCRKGQHVRITNFYQQFEIFEEILTSHGQSQSWRMFKTIWTELSLLKFSHQRSFKLSCGALDVTTQPHAITSIPSLIPIPWHSIFLRALLKHEKFLH